MGDFKNSDLFLSVTLSNIIKCNITVIFLLGYRRRASQLEKIGVHEGHAQRPREFIGKR